MNDTAGSLENTQNDVVQPETVQEALTLQEASAPQGASALQTEASAEQLPLEQVEDKTVKVVLVQTYQDSDETDTETPWALDMGNNQYQLKNFPFFFYGLSFNDIFEAKPSEAHPDDPHPYFVRLIEKSGHRTVRIFLKNSIQDSVPAAQVLEQLKALHCGYEGNGSTFFVVNIQPHCDFEAVIALIENSPEVEMWEMADPFDEDDDE